MSFTDIIGKLFSWIPGIGNAALRDRVTLAQEEAAAFRRKSEASALREVNLESEVKTLRFELQQCAAKTHALENALAEKQQQDDSKDLPEKEHGILVFIHSNGGEPRIEQISGHLGLSEDGALCYLVRLDRDNFIYPRSNFDGEQWWKLTQKGREYLAKRELLR